MPGARFQEGLRVRGLICSSNTGWDDWRAFFRLAPIAGMVVLNGVEKEFVHRRRHGKFERGVALSHLHFMRVFGWTQDRVSLLNVVVNQESGVHCPPRRRAGRRGAMGFRRLLQGLTGLMQGRQILRNG